VPGNDPLFRLKLTLNPSSLQVAAERPRRGRLPTKQAVPLSSSWVNKNSYENSESGVGCQRIQCDSIRPERPAGKAGGATEDTSYGYAGYCHNRRRGFSGVR
jgi:hypothetical protein